MHPQITLTSDEKAWLADHPIIRSAADDYPPFEMKDDNGNYTGYAADIFNLAVSLENGTHVIELLATHYPNITQLVKSNPLEAIKALSSGQVDAYIGNQAVTSYLLNKNVITNLKSVGFYEEASEPLKMGIRSDMPLLRDILDKGLATITTKEKNEILGRYIFRSDSKTETKKIDLTEEERAWLDEHPTIKVSNEMDYPPFDFTI